METGSALFKSIWDKLEARPDHVIHFRQCGSSRWKPVKNRQYQMDILSTALFFKNKDFQKGDEVGLILPTCYEWDVIEKASFLLGLNIIAVDPRQKMDFQFSSLIRNCKMIVIKNTIHLTESSEDKISLKLVQIQNLPILKKEPLKATELVFNKAESFDDLNVYTIFTSGSTGEPKALRYTQKQVQEAVETIVNIFKGQLKEEKILAWLPLANPFQRMFNLTAIYLEANIYFEENPTEIMQSLKKVKPTVLIGVPFLFEKLKSIVQKKLKTRFPFKYLMVTPFGDFIETYLVQYLLGNHLKFCISGSAALQAETLLYYKNKKIDILEAYGMSESILPVALNTPNSWKLGSVGKILEPQSLMISEEGEVYLRTSFISKTLMIQDGQWMKTNDHGILDGEGYLFLRGRGTDFIKLATGNKITRFLVEYQIQQINGVGQCALMGNEMGSLSIVISTTPDYYQSSGAHLDISYWKKEISRINERLIGYQKVHSAILLFRPFSIEQNEMTNNLKLKYTSIEAKFKPLIKSFVESDKEMTSGALSDNKLEFAIIRVGL